jgi:hypothetical protein
MEAKAYPAFGYVLVRCKINAGEIINDISVDNGVMTIDAVNEDGVATIKNSGYVWLQILGQQTYTEQATGNATIHLPGWCNLVDDIAAGMHNIHVDAYSEHICLATHLNELRNPKMPSLSLFKMVAGEQRALPQDTKLYLVEGVLDIAGRKFPGMRQIHFQSGAKTVVADADCMGFVFNM